MKEQTKSIVVKAVLATVALSFLAGSVFADTGGLSQVQDVRTLSGFVSELQWHNCMINSQYNALHCSAQAWGYSNVEIVPLVNLDFFASLRAQMGW